VTYYSIERKTMADSVIQTIEPSTSFRSEVEDALAAAIVAGEIQPGTLLSVPTLAARFGVSATPVREAVLQLEKRGFVVSVRNKGFRVTQVSEQDLRDIVQVRRWLEAPAMRIIAAKMPKIPIQPYRTLATAIVAAAANSDFPAYLAADSAFHLSILELVDNKKLVDLVGELRKQTRMVGLVGLANSSELQKSADEHHLLLDLLSEGRGDEAEQLMLAHIGHVSGWWAGQPEDSLLP
jgi:DNA-binding GntR family transcriptional regulator